jgi:excisionase family DNA binding protein
MPNQVLLTVEDVAKRLQLKVGTVRGYLREGKLVGARIAKNKVWRVREEALEAFIRGLEEGR